MGRRVHFNLADIVCNPQVKVELYSSNIVESEGITTDNMEQLAKVTLLPLQPDYGAEPEHAEEKSVLFDVVAHSGEVTLETDLNQWGSHFQEKLSFLYSLGCPFTVV